MSTCTGISRRLGTAHAPSPDVRCVRKPNRVSDADHCVVRRLGLPVPHRRTLTPPIVGSARSMLSPLRRAPIRRRRIGRGCAEKATPAPGARAAPDSLGEVQGRGAGARCRGEVQGRGAGGGIGARMASVGRPRPLASQLVPSRSRLWRVGGEPPYGRHSMPRIETSSSGPLGWHQVSTASSRPFTPASTGAPRNWAMQAAIASSP